MDNVSCRGNSLGARPQQGWSLVIIDLFPVGAKRIEPQVGHVEVAGLIGEL